jgi:SAM-dependent MidA family methyltransferase
MQAKPIPQSLMPEPDPASAAHSKRVAEFLRDKMTEAGGSIGFAEFMQHALYAPGLGYYSSGSRKFGVDGDFVTAPEISPLFGRVLARQCATVLSQRPGSSVLELGAGSGALATEMLKKLRSMRALPERYLILEPSADLQARQQERLAEALPELAQRVEWIAGWPPDFVGAVIANEVADALPVTRFAIRERAVTELCVSIENNGFAWTERPAAAGLDAAIRGIEREIGRDFPEDYVSEICLALPAWIGDLAECLKDGFVFLFDYGVSRREYYSAERNRGWLRCHFRHRAHDDPFAYPGIQDITAWVDFSAIAEAAAKNGMQVAGLTSQAHFLLHGGLQDELADFLNLSQREQFELSRQVKLLTLPGEMGENFKCIGLAKGAAIVPTIFEHGDRAHIL